METITIRPKSKRQWTMLASPFRELEIDFSTDGQADEATAPEPLGAKIMRLYRDGHCTDAEVDRFFSIPKEHRVDPFDIIDDGDVYWADRRNIEALERNTEQARKDMREGRTAVLGPTDSLDDFMARIMADDDI